MAMVDDYETSAPPLELEPAACCICGSTDGESSGVGEDFEYHVSPDTFLPVRVVFGDIEMDYRWLQPTAANLAKLTPQIPRGFRQTHENVAR